MKSTLLDYSVIAMLNMDVDLS